MNNGWRVGSATSTFALLQFYILSSFVSRYLSLRHLAFPKKLFQSSQEVIFEELSSTINCVYYGCSEQGKHESQEITIYLYYI